MYCMDKQSDWHCHALSFELHVNYVAKYCNSFNRHVYIRAKCVGHKWWQIAIFKWWVKYVQMHAVSQCSNQHCTCFIMYACIYRCDEIHHSCHITTPVFNRYMPDVSCFLRICAFREFLQKARHRVAGFKFGIGSTACAFYRKCQEFALSESGIAPFLHREEGSICYLVTYFCSKLNSKKVCPKIFGWCWMFLPEK